MVILSDQPLDFGPVAVEGLPNVVLFSVEAVKAASSEFPFCETIASALDLALEAALGLGFGVRPCGPSLAEALPELRRDEKRYGRYGKFGGDCMFPAFEPAGADHYDFGTPRGGIGDFRHQQQ